MPLLLLLFKMKRRKRMKFFFYSIVNTNSQTKYLLNILNAFNPCSIALAWFLWYVWHIHICIRWKALVRRILISSDAIRFLTLFHSSFICLSIILSVWMDGEKKIFVQCVVVGILLWQSKQMIDKHIFKQMNENDEFEELLKKSRKILI